MSTITGKLEKAQKALAFYRSLKPEKGPSSGKTNRNSNLARALDNVEKAVTDALNEAQETAPQPLTPGWERIVLGLTLSTRTIVGDGNFAIDFLPDHREHAERFKAQLSETFRVWEQEPEPVEKG